MTKLLRNTALTLLVTFATSVSADSSAQSTGPGRTRPLPDTMSAQHRLQIRKTSRWIQDDQSSPEMEAQRAQVLSKKRRILIKELEKTTKGVKDDAKKLDLSLRLGRLYLEEYYAGLNTAHEKYQRALDSYRRNPARKKEPRLSQASALSSLNKASRLYKDLKKRYPKSKRQDEILYFFALSSMDKGMEKPAMEAFRQLVERSPRSRYTADAMAQLGDYHFREHQLEQAEMYFDKIVRRKLQPLVSYAMYKKAWCAYHTERPEEALKLLTWVIENEKPSTGADSSLRVKNEALADITLMFTELNLVSRSIAFFRAFEEPTYRRGLESMAGMYREKAKHASAIALLENLIEFSPTHSGNPSYESGIIEILVLKDDLDGAVARLVKRVPLYLQGSSWNKKNRSDEAIVRAGETGLEEMTRKLAFRLHDTAQKVKNEKHYDYAKELYVRYLEFFPKWAESSRVRFHLAKLHFKRKSYVEAAQEYTLVYQDESAGALRSESIVQALASLSKDMAENPGETVQKPGNRTKSLDGDEEAAFIAYGKVEEMFLDLSLVYLKHYPEAKDYADVLYERGYLMYRHYNFDGALGIFGEIVAKHFKHSTATSAAHLSLDILNRRKDYPGLVAGSEALLARGFESKKFVAEVEEILRRAELKIVDGLEKLEKFEAAAEGYMHYVQKYGTQDEALHERALHNASVNYTKAGRFVSALETQEKFLRTFPKSKLAPQTQLQVARGHESMGQLGDAARYYAGFAQAYPKQKDARNALQLAGWHYWGAGDVARAEKNLTAYLEAYPADPSGERSLTAFYESQGLEDALIRFLKQARQRKGMGPVEFVERTVGLAELVAKDSPREAAKLLTEAADAAHKHESALRKKARGAELLSKIDLWEIQDKESHFYKIRLNRSSTLEANLKRKLELLKELEKDFARISSFGSEEYGLAAMYRTARAHWHIAQEATGAPVPASLSGKALEAYQTEIKSVIVVPFQEKAETLAQRCLDESNELHLYTRWTAKCFSLAAEVNPKKFIGVRTFYLPPLQTAILAPDPKDSRIPIGAKIDMGAVGFSSRLLYANSLQTTAVGSASPLFGSGDEAEEFSSATSDPVAFDAEFLAEARSRIVEREVASLAPGSDELPSFAYLNLLRLKKPEEAVTAIRAALRTDPNSAALHNLLGVAYLDGGNLSAAEVTWSAMVARGQKNAAILNNLGVLSLVRGKQSQAVAYFNEARNLEESSEAWTNLGFLALKYRSGQSAKESFEEAKRQGHSASAEVGVLVAQMQAGDLDDLRGTLEDLTKKHKADPYARLVVAYYLIDVEKDFALASRVLNEYLEDNNVQEAGGHFQRALREAANGMNAEVASLSVPGEN